jgi:release factor glutamine methyltransferase
MLWRELLADAARRLAAAGIENAAFEARLLVGHAAGLSAEQLVLERDEPVPQDAAAAAEAVVVRRCAREPAAQIIGHREFWGLTFAVSRDVLTPRPDSETLVEAVLAALPDRNRPFRLLDLGVGSGCLALALLTELPRARGVGIDISPAAMAVARHNARALGLASRIGFRLADWTHGVAGMFDIVVSNPPYIRTADLRQLDPEVATFEPRHALDGGSDGLAAYRRLATEIPSLVRPGGLVALEVGQDQAAAVRYLFENKGLIDLSTRRDLGGIERVVVARRR